MADDGSIGGNYTMFFWLKNPLQVANGSRYVDVQYLTDGASFLSHRYVCFRCPSVAIANIVALLRGMLHAHALWLSILPGEIGGKEFSGVSPIGADFSNVKAMNRPTKLGEDKPSPLLCYDRSACEARP